MKNFFYLPVQSIYSLVTTKCITHSGFGRFAQIGSLLLLLLSGHLVTAQSLTWQGVGYGNLSTSGLGPGAGRINSMALGADGSVYVTGFYTYTLTVETASGPVSIAGGMQPAGTSLPAMFVGKWNPTTSKWVWITGSTGGSAEGRSIAVDGSNVYVTGHYSDGGSTIGGVPLTNTNSGNDFDIFLAKYVDGGTTFSNGWALKVGGSSAANSTNDIGRAIAVNGDNIYIAGTFSGNASIAGTTLIATSSSTDTFLAKYVDSGATPTTLPTSKWALSFGSDRDESTTTVAVNGLNVYVGANFAGSMVVNGIPLATTGNTDTDFCLVKYVDNGDTFTNGWAIKGGGSGTTDNINDVYVNNSGIYLTGGFTSGATIAGTNLTSTLTSSQNLYVAKYTDGGASATGVWARGVSTATGTTQGNSLAVSGSNVFVGGNLNGSATIAGTSLVSAGATDIFLAQFTDNASSVTDAGGYRAGTSSTENGLAVAANGNLVYLAGVARTGTAFGSNTINSTSALGLPFIAKGQTSGAVAPDISGFDANKDIACTNTSVTFTATISNVSAPYTFTLTSSGGASFSGTTSGTNFSQNLTLTGSGSQTITLTINASSQTASATTNVTVSALSATSSVTHVTCNNSTNGRAILSVSGGTTPYFYSWSPSGGTSAFATNLPANTYNVTVTDNNGCQITPMVSVTQPATALSATTSVTHVSCTGFSTGRASVNVSGGTPGYTYNWTPSGGSVARTTPVAAGSYTVTITDANSCTITRTVSVTQPAVLDATTSATHVICNGSTAGRASVSVSGGTPNYQYSWSNGGSTAMVTGLSSNTYTVTITDNNGCQITRMVSVTQPAAVATAGSQTNVTTYGGSDGVASVTASGGTPGYTYHWGPGSPTGQNTSRISGLSAGVYSVTIADANNCTLIRSYTITQPDALTVTGFAANPSTACVGSPVTFTATIGNVTGAYDFTLTNGPSSVTGTTSSTAFSQSLVAAGTGNQLFLLIVSANSQQVLAMTNLQVNGLPALTLSGGNVCEGQSVSLSATSGLNSYTFTGISGVIAGLGNTRTIPELSANTYNFTVTATNSQGCSNSATTALTVNSLPTAQLTVAPSAILTCTNPSLTLTASGGNSYSFTGSGIVSQDVNAGTAVVNASGTYSVSVTNTTTGCSSVTTIGIEQNISQPGVSISSNIGTPSSTTLTCANPTAILTVEGTGTVRWSTGATSTTIAVNSADTYSVTLTGANGCSSTANTNVVEDKTPPTVSINPSTGSPTGTTLTCASPTVSLSVVGVGTYLWSTGAITSSISVSVADTYSVTLTGTNGCISTTSISVSQDQTPPSLTINPSSATLTCASPTVSLSAVGSGTYHWNTGAITSVFSVTSADTYSVTLTAANGCTASAVAQVSLDQTPPTIAINPSIGTPTGATLTCANPVVSLSAVGSGTYRWSTGATTSSISVTAADTYSVTLTGANGCSASASIAISLDNTPPTVSVTPTSATLICTNPTASLSAVGSGTYRWSTGAITSSILVSEAGLYSVTVTGANGCSASANSNVIYQNCAPTLANAIPSQSAVLGNTFSYTIPANTFTDPETPNALTLTVSGLPAGLSFVSPNTITGTPSTSIGSPFSVTVVATDPGGLSASTSFLLSILPRNFAITGVTMLDCNHLSYFERRINFTVSFEATNGQPISLSVVNEATTITINEPYQLNLFTDNPVIVFKARQQGSPGEATFSYNWLAFCANGNPRVENAIPPQSATVGQAFSYTIPATTFTDAETPTSLTLSVVGLPAGLSFVAPATIVGSVSAIASSFYSVTVTATDPSGGSVSTILPLSVVNPGGCVSMYSLKAGDWNDASVWSCGRVPLLTDVVTVNHAVSLPATYQGQALRVIYSSTGRLLFNTGSRLRLGGN
ncbi:hypothetical protein IC229_16620 [Spirosoma sp. BT702]|uniref:Ig-like domain-containing protein n=1 Tax=Spirosoma profusum TaxID=2771354 RepID=A0A926XX72_9BACT|nr:putative Ig domain-containing protein [Spirosoma profusum]MBD2702279.1 hypothetical protein [Spirosoma profusum]